MHYDQVLKYKKVFGGVIVLQYRFKLFMYKCYKWKVPLQLKKINIF